METRPRCKSTCRKRTPDDCRKTVRCSYTNGSKRQFCRLSAKYKMNKQTCKIGRRFSKKSATQRIRDFVVQAKRAKSEKSEKAEKAGPSGTEIQEFHNKVQARRLARFMRGVDPHKRRAAFLRGVCSDAGVCIAFGKENAKIRKHFDGFTSFQHLSGTVNRIGTVSANGFVKSLTYSRNGYSANAILKSSAKADSDNLYYEYLVGKYINKQSLRFPCFVETYGAFKYINEVSYGKAKEESKSGVDSLQNGLRKIPETPTPELLEHSCSDSKHIAVLIQHLKDVFAIQQKIRDESFVKHDLLYVLFQVYMPLSILRNEYTHYDLHTDNVLVYQPVKGSYIQYHNHMAGENVVSFKSSYIAKIIDYGRCFFDDRENPGMSGSAKRIYNAVCATPKCPHCGDDMGYTWLEPLSKTRPASQYYISSQIANHSHDLRLLAMLSNKKCAINQSTLRIIKILNPELFGTLTRVVYKGKYGTPSHPASGMSNLKIYNVSDAAESLASIIRSIFTVMVNEHRYSAMTKLGDMHVYSDGRPLEFLTA